MSKKISDNRKSAANAMKKPADLAAERQRARERIRYVKPEIAGKVLGHDRYWTVQFLDLYLERCDETAFDVPRDAYLLAQHLPEVARRIRVGPKARDWDTPLEKMGGIVMALAVKGSCCRAVDEIAEAELCFDRAFKGLGNHQPSPVVMAELHRRYAALLLMKRSSGVEKHIDHCLEYSEEASYKPGVADALTLRGVVNAQADPAQAVQDFLQATRLADLKSPRGERTAKAAMHNVSYAVAYGSVGLRDQETALRLLVRLKNELKGTPTSVRKLKVLWIEGLILGNLRIERHAKRQLSKARRGLLSIGDVGSYLVVSIDLYRSLIEFGDEEEAREIALDTLSQAEAHNQDPELLARLRRWVEEKPALEKLIEMRGLVQN